MVGAAGFEPATSGMEPHGFPMAHDHLSPGFFHLTAPSFHHSSENPVELIGTWSPLRYLASPRPHVPVTWLGSGISNWLEVHGTLCQKSFKK